MRSLLFLFLFIGVCAISHAQVSGTFIVSQDGSADFSSIGEAAEYFNSQGISGSTILKLKAGTYEEQAVFDMSANKVGASFTITSFTGNPEDVTISYKDAATDTTNYNLRFVNAAHLTIKDLTFDTQSAERGRMIEFEGTGNDITIVGNRFYGNRNDAAVFLGYGTTMKFFTEIIYYDEMDALTGLTVKDNFFTLVSSGVANSNLPDTTMIQSDLIIEGNDFFDANGVNIFRAKDMRVSNNLFHGDLYKVKAIQLSNCGENIRIEKNKIWNSMLGISIKSSKFPEDSPAIVANNFISGKDEVVLISISENVNFVHNSVNAFSGQILLTNNKGLSVHNNIFVQREDEALFSIFTDESFPALDMDYNCFYAPNGSLAFNWDDPQDPVTTLEDFREWFGTDAHSVYLNPEFVSDSDLHATAVGIKDIGLALPYITEDIDGEPRPAGNPDIGADEITKVFNMTIDEVVVNPVAAKTDRAITIKWSGKNAGDRNLTAPWKDLIWLSRDQQIGDGDILLGHKDIVHDIAADASFQHIRSLSLDIDSVGAWYVIVEMDGDRMLIEDHADNVGVSELINITYSDRPDLVVTDISTVPNINSGVPLTIQYTVKNIGTAPTDGKWLDFIYFGSNRTYLESEGFNYDSLRIGAVDNPAGLAPGESYTGSFQYQLPLKGSGEYFIKILADGEAQVRELEDENSNNSYTGGKVQVQQMPLADLEVVSFNAPVQAFSGTRLDFSYTVKNTGSAPTSNDFRYDYIYITTSPVPTDETFRSSFKRRKRISRWVQLEPGEEDFVQESITLPFCEENTYYLYVFTDVLDKIPELAETNNGIAAKDALEAVMMPNGDLIVEDFQILSGELQTEEKLEIEYFVHNDGFNDLFVFRNMADGIYLSKLDTLNKEEARKILHRYYFDTLSFAPGESLHRKSSIYLPDSMHGTYNIFINADDPNEFCEYPFENNNYLKYGPVDIKLAPKRDLFVSDLEVSTRGVAGEQINISYSIENTGETDTAPKELTDSLFIVPVGEVLSEKYFFTKHEQSISIPKSGKVQKNLSLTLPIGLKPGYYQIYVKTDATDLVYEHQAEGNNISWSAEIPVNRNPGNVPDLVVENISISGDLNSGEAISINYTVQNMTSKSTYIESWKDLVFLASATDTAIIVDRETYHFSPMAGHASYTVSADFILPEGKFGEYFIGVRADKENRIYEYEEVNNQYLKKVSIALSPWPDLKPTFISHKDTLVSGQYTLVSWLVNNEGIAMAVDTPWVDKVYLSRDRILDDGDIKIFQIENKNQVASGSSYQKSEQFRVPTSAEGEFYLIVNIDDNNRLYEHTDEDNNYLVTDGLVRVVKPKPIDLFPLAISMDLPSMGSAGYEVKNQGPNSAFGSWVDALYLSSDKTLDKNDVLLGYHEHYAPEDGIETDDFYTVAEDFPVEFVKPGYYYLIIKADVFNYMPETDISNNVVASFESFYIDMIEDLIPDVPKDSVFKKYWSRDHYYELEVPAEKGVLLTLDASSMYENTELYYRRDELPGRGGPFDFRGLNDLSPDQEIIVPSMQSSSTDYILAHTSPVNYDMNYTIKAELKDFSIINVTPEAGGQEGIIVMDINGIDFSDSLSAWLTNGVDSVEAVHTFSRSNILARSHFNLNSLSPGVYDVMLQRLDRGDQTRLEGAFTVEDSAYYGYKVEIVAPGSQRGGRPFDVQVQYANNGNINDYDVFLYVAFYQGDFETEDLEIEYLGDGISGNIPDSIRFHPFNDDALIKDEKAYFYIGWLPVFPAQGHGDLSFRIRTSSFDTVHVAAGYFKNPLSRIHFTGNLDDLKESVFLKQYDSLFTQPSYSPNAMTASSDISPEKPRYAANARVAAECIDDPKVVTALIWKGVRGHAEYISGGIPGSPTDIVTTLIQEGVKSYIDPDAHIRAEDLAKDLTDKRREIVLDPTKKTAYDHLAKNLDECLKTEVVTDFRERCLIAYTMTVETLNGPRIRTAYRPNPACNPNNPPPNVPFGGDPDDDEDIRIINPKDPNEIVGPLGKGGAQYVTVEETLPYTIRFENVATATAPAQVVVIENPLDEGFDIKDFRLQSIGWGDTIINLPENAFFNGSFDLGPEFYNHRLDVVAGLDPINHSAFWRFTTIDPVTGALPENAMAGFLPPNDSTHIGEGFVTYTIGAQDTLSPGSQLRNSATIVFDSEESLETNEWINTIPGDVPYTFVNALPAFTDDSTFVVSWQPDTAAMYAVPTYSYSIYVAVDDGLYELWLQNTSASQAVFEAEAGKTYRFYSRGFSADNRAEPAPTRPDATIGVRLEGVTGVIGKEQHQDFILYPNPADNQLTMRYYLNKPAEIQILFYDLIGRIQAATVAKQQGSGSHEVDLSEQIQMLSKGLYNVVFIKNGERKATLFIKN